jgi:hypothetical protein
MTNEAAAFPVHTILFSQQQSKQLNDGIDWKNSLSIIKAPLCG